MTVKLIYRDGTTYNTSENCDYFESEEKAYEYIVEVMNTEREIENAEIVDDNGETIKAY